MELKVSGGGIGNPGKIMFYMGMLFVVLGVIIGVGWFVIAGGIGEIAFGLGGILFLAIFGGIGGFFAWMGNKMLNEGRQILEEGVEYLGKIFAYEPDHRVTMNGAPCITLVIRYMRKGEICEARANTGEANAALFPIGATIAFKLLNGMAAVVPGSVSDIELEDEQSLMNPDLDPRGIKSSISVSCPNCAANVVVPLGMSRFCPYCETKISLTADGDLANVR